MRARVDTTQRKNENKQSTKILKIKPYANKTQSYEMTTNNNKEDLKQKNNHLSQIS